MPRLRPEQLQTPLFDVDWYLDRYPEVARAGIDPRLHYVEEGEAGNYRPNPLFHPDWVRAHLDPDTETSPLAAFIESGGRIRPNPLFDPAWYLGAHGTRMDDQSCALSHYLAHGASLDLWPHPLFDPRWYREAHPELTTQRDPLFAHYIDVGETAGYRPNRHFDPDWVRAQYLPFGLHCDRCARAHSALTHYHEVGALRGDRPEPFFDPNHVRARYPISSGAASGPLAWFLMRTREGDTLEENALLEPDAQKREPSEAPNRYFDSYRAHLDAASEITGASEIRDDPLLDYLAALPAAERTPLTDPFPAHDRVVASVIIPTFDHWFHTAACLHSLAAAHTRAPFEVIVADDGSHIPAPDNPLFQGPGLQILRSDHNRGFLHNCNAAARVANGDHLVFLNNDTLVTDHWLDELLASFERFDGVGMVGSLLLQPNGRVSEAGGLVFCDGSAWNFARHRKADDREVRFARDTDYVSGASLCIERRLFESLGGFDPLFAPAYFEDTDLAFRVRRAGKRVIYQPHSRVFHFEGVTSGTDLEQGVKQHQVLNQSTFADRWRKEVAHHGERGVAPEREKDRHFRGRALVIDVCMPTPARDARSHALVIAMKHLRDEGFRVTFVPENLDAPDALAAPLRGSGIEVLGGRDLSSIDEHLLREGRDVDLCWLARRAVDDRWRPVCESRCPGAQVATLDLERVDVAVEPTRSEPGEFRGPGFASREDVFVVTGVRDDVVADSLLWLRDEVLPAFRNTALRSTLPPRFVVRERDWLNVVCGPSDALQPIDESQIAEAQTLDRYRIAIAPARFGGDLSGAVGIALSQGLPCVVTSHVAARLPAAQHPAIAIADDPQAFACAIDTWHCDQARWQTAATAASTHPAALRFEALAAHNIAQVLR